MNSENLAIASVRSRNLSNDLAAPDRYGKLTVIKHLGLRKVHYKNNVLNRTFVSVKCDCGTEQETVLATLKSGKKKSCGCLQKENGIALRAAVNLRYAGEPVSPGKKFGYLTVLQDLGLQKSGDRNLTVVQVKCSCGTVRTVQRTHLVSGKVQSCGCLIKVKAAIMGKAQAKEFGHRALIGLYGTYQRRSLKRSQEFQLTIDQFRELTSLPCAYCEALPDIKEGYAWNGIDRIDSQKGYLADNCLPCCYTCNRAKMDMSMTNWEEYLNRLSPKTSYRPVGWVSVDKITDGFGKTVSIEKAVKYGWLKLNSSVNQYNYADDPYATGRLELGPNLFVDQGRQLLCYALGFRSPIQDYVLSKFAVGTGTTTARTTDVNLEAPVTLSSGSELGNIETVDYLSAFVMRVAFTLGLSDANGFLISEMGLFSGGNALIARRVRSVGIAKSSDFSPTLAWRIRF